MSIHVPGFQSFFSFFLHHFAMAKLATSSIGINNKAKIENYMTKCFMLPIDIQLS